MTKAEFEKTIATAKAAGINNFVVRCQGGNRICYHNESTGKIIPKDNSIISIEVSRNYAYEHQTFVVSIIPYDNIDSIILQDTNFENSIKVLKGLSAYTEEVENFFKQSPDKMGIIPGTGALVPRTDKDGNPEVSAGSVGYVTK